MKDSEFQKLDQRKIKSRMRDMEAIAIGKVSREQLRRQNGYFAAKNAKVHYL